MTPEQRAWVRANMPGDRSHIPTYEEAAEVLGRPLPPVADCICNVVTRREAERIRLESLRDDLRRNAELARWGREDEWASYYEGE